MFDPDCQGADGAGWRRVRPERRRPAVHLPPDPDRPGPRGRRPARSDRDRTRSPTPRLPFGLRTVDGSFNHLDAGQTLFGASDQLLPAHDDAALPPASTQPARRRTRRRRRRHRPAAAHHQQPDRRIRRCATRPPWPLPPGRRRVAEPLGTLPIPNVAPDAGLSAPFNSMFTFFGQFFDHGLDLVNKGAAARSSSRCSRTIRCSSPGSPTNFMVLTPRRRHSRWS